MANTRNYICYNRYSNNYNYLKNIALTMKHSQLDIPLREMSYQDNSSMDVDKLSSTPKLILK